MSNLKDMPGIRPPPGVVPNFDSPANMNALSYFTFSLCLSVVTVALVLRIYTRWFVIHKPFVVDYVLIVSYCLNVAASGIVYRMIATTGLFVHQWDVRLLELAPFIRGSFISSLIHIVFIPCAKAAIFLEWIRIFSPGSRGFVFWSCHVIMWANIICYAVIFLLLNIACTPYEYNWNRLIPGGGCGRVNIGAIHTTAGAVNLATDILIFLIPQRAIWSLRMSRQRKMGVAAIFAIGVLGIAAAAGRLAGGVIRNGSTDFTYTFSAVILCAEAEGTCSLLVVCGPAIPQAVPALPRAIASIRSWASSSVGKLRYGKSSSKGSSGGAGTSGSRGSAAMPSLPSIPLAKLRPPRTGYEDLESGSILRETEFAAEEEYIDAPRESSIHGRQHPWTGVKV